MNMTAFYPVYKTIANTMLAESKRYIIILLLFISPSAFSQHLRFDHLSVKQGLSQGNVLSIYQDKLGFMWICTEDGLNVYDGYNFKTFRNDPEDSSSISNNRIHHVIEDE